MRRFAAGVCALLACAAAAAQPQPLLVPESGAHGAPVRRVDSGQGVIVTASDDRTARVWDAADGAALQVLRPFAFGAQGGRLYGVAIHPREPIVAVAGTTGGADGATEQPHVIYLFHLRTGVLEATIDARAGDVRRLAWSADGSVLLAGYAGTHGVRAFARDGRELLDDRFGGPVFGLAVHANGLAAAVGLDGEVRSYRVGAGAARRLATLPLAGRRAAGVAFSPDGRRLAVVYAQRGEGPELFDAEPLAARQRLPAPPSWGGDFRVVAWDADGRSLWLGGTAHTRELRFPLVQVDAASGAPLATIEVAADSVTDVQPRAEGGIAYASFDGSWGTLEGGRARSQGQPLVTVRGDQPLDLELNDDATALRWARGSSVGGLAFDFATRRLLRGGGAPAARAPETRFGLFSAPSDWNQEARPPAVAGRPLPLAADERGRAMAVARVAPAAAYFGTNRALYRVDEQGRVVWQTAVDTEVRAVNTRADGRAVVTALADGTLRWWRASDGRLLLTLLALADGRWVAWTPSGYFDASPGADRIAGWALPQGPRAAMPFASLNRLRERYNRPDVVDMVLKTLDEEAAFAQIAQQEASAQAALREAAAREAAAARAARQAAEEQALAARRATEQEAARRAAEAERLAALAEAERRTRLEAERQAARAEAERQARAEAERREREAAERVRQAEAAARRAAELAREAEQRAAELAREAEERDAGERARRALAALRAIEFPPAVRAGIEPRLRTTSGTVTLPFVVSAPQGAGEVTVEVRLAGRPAGGVELTLPRTVGAAATARLEVPPGTSVVEIIASNRYGPSEPLLFTIEREAAAPPPAGGDLYLLAIGISEYALRDLQLGVAAKDALDFAAAMRGQEGRQYRRVVIHTLTDRAATRAAVLRELAWLRESVGAGDTAMLFLAGHGVNDAAGQYFFVPHDGHPERLTATAVTQQAIVSTLAQVRGRTIAFIDTCYAGNALGALNRSPKRTDRLINDLAAAENGVIVFASSTGREESLEHPDWGNGAFTKALLEGLAGKADFMRAGRVTYAALNLFVSEEVTRMTQGRQRPVFISPRGVPDFAVVRL